MDIFVVFLEISSDIILSVINASQADESSFPKYKISIFFNCVLVGCIISVNDSKDLSPTIISSILICLLP